MLNLTRRSKLIENRVHYQQPWKLFLVVNGNQFRKTNQKKDRVFWRYTLQCAARVIHDIKTQELSLPSKIVLNHPIIANRQKKGELQIHKALYGKPVGKP